MLASVVNEVAQCSILVIVLLKCRVHHHRKKCQKQTHQVQKNFSSSSSKSKVDWDGKLLHDVTGDVSHKIDRLTSYNYTK